MSIEKIVGRKSQTEILKKAYESHESEFVAIYGRRRIGKTYLIREFFNEKITFELTGILGASLKDQLENFAGSMERAIGTGIQPKVPSSWREAFTMIERFLDSGMAGTTSVKKVVFLDELPWLNTPRSKFLSALQHFWNNYCTKRSDIVLIVCGSAASWMIQNIVRAKGGLHNRLTRQIRLLPFTLEETKQYLQKRNIRNLDNYSILQIYMAFGGIPYYLSFVESGKSPAQVIDALCFDGSGPLRMEYDQLYRSLFDKSGQHMKIIGLLAVKRKGLSRSEILQEAGLRSGGTASTIIEELEESGFIAAYVPFGKRKKDMTYRLVDEYSLFYLKWIKPLGKQNPGDGYWLTRQNSQKYKSWAGYSFEGICLKHVNKLKDALGISKVSTTESSWRFQPVENTEDSGAQIDLLIDRADGVINLCEMKFYAAEFVIDAKYAGELKEKVRIFRDQSKSRKNIFITLVTTFGTKQNPHSLSLEVIDLRSDVLF